MWNKIGLFLKKHDSYITGVVVWTNLIGGLQAAAEGKYGWAVVNFAVLFWFQYLYNQKKKDVIDN